ncbi:MAG TPA: UDP-N-acetylmuramoyl-L-alanine--D-glutamate ligase [Beijerinckiaceae bacterium]
MTPATTFAGQTVALFGLGGSGLATALALRAGGARVVACDDSAEAMAKAEAQGIGPGDLRNADWSEFAALVLSPGVPLTHPEPHWSVRLAQAAGVEVIGDIELFCREREKIAPDAPFVAITGTNGKSTTTALVAHILREAGRDVQMGGNIGTAILSLEPPARGRFHVVEMSSFQIDLTPSLKPTIGVLLNISPDHLDRHGTMENYARIKGRLVAGADRAIIGIDDEQGRAIDDLAQHFADVPPVRISAAPIAPAEIFSNSMVHNEAVYADGARIIAASIDGELFRKRFNPHFPPRRALTEDQRAEMGRMFSDLAEELLVRTEVANLDGIASLWGRHNAQNAAAAAAASLALGVEPTQIAAATRTFPGLPHRMEEVGRLSRAIFVNDSKATNADSTEKALASFDRVLWILGGKAKEGGIESLRPYFPKVERAYLIGEASDAFAATLGDAVSFVRSGTLDKAVAQAAEDAARSNAPEPVVLLSPACASYDQFKNFEERGNRFRDLVRVLPGIEVKGL